MRLPVAKSKKRMDLSLPAVASVLPSGEIATAVTAAGVFLHLEAAERFVVLVLGPRGASHDRKEHARDQAASPEVVHGWFLNLNVL